MVRLLLFTTVALLIHIFETSEAEASFFLTERMFQPENHPETEQYERWFTQNLDHFNPNDERTWQQRYFINDEFASGKGNLAFLLIGGEAEASSYLMTTGSWITYARKYKPILFQLEHRYYGKSHPTEDLSTENLVYLTSQQALRDLAFFIEAMNQKYNLTRDVKWIVFGGSYSGNLAAWLRLKYPHLVHGAMSASAPLLAKLDFPGAGHCENMFGPSYDDTPPLMTARVQIGELIGTWINS
ncbi:putative serine protease F56F10.1 [Diabrotica virgifera virgifera]|uniref:Serine protease K12H4.7 n=2 Tax=Diabrotica virgifera virgifera TaxID=50390 RepID=A0ABM5KTU8_DIAVI|nr:putative serine protease F56F10.1 [Diabrotica virgifera virgifera]